MADGSGADLPPTVDERIAAMRASVSGASLEAVVARFTTGSPTDLAAIAALTTLCEAYEAGPALPRRGREVAGHLLDVCEALAELARALLADAVDAEGEALGRGRGGSAP